MSWFDGRFENLSKKMDESDHRASDSRREVYKELKEQGRAIIDMQHRIAAVEKSLEDAKPTLAFSNDVKTHVIVARRIVLALWAVALVCAAWLVSKWDAISAAWKAFSGK